MRDAHQRSRQSCAALAPFLAAALAGCAASDPPPSIWPPADFRCEVEEVALRDGALHVVRRVRFDASGVVVYGTSSRSLIDPETNTALPVFDRLAVYQLVPYCLRMFARRLEQRGITTLDTVQGERGVSDQSGVALRWRAFGSERVLTARGRVHGTMADILALVDAHLPSGERFGLADEGERPIVAVLRDVPSPALDARGALQAHQDLLTAHGEDAQWLLDAFSLACAASARADAEALLARWSALAAARQATRRSTPFPDENLEGLTTEILRRLLPPQGG